ncbi:uncharacterized protein N7459_007599 [Penicillium hispanicum]|uniref:uncharacterized protein n=1 Tax=Penicillium hispanicum TaxID=1080232 RepID=UPI002542382C|nr:uncharacterized protein N7459_007599 [Penicillium hispanicum]KAJ5578635.1 hypothetical protein N7459_007599 [Penicillium hispanicum]
MPMRRINVKGKAPSRGSEDDRYVFSDFANLSLADERIPGRSYGPGNHYSSSEPKYDTRSSRYARNSPPPKPYHGPHFEKGPAQEELWDARGSREVWDPYKPERSVAARPETHGRAHSIHQSRMEHHYSDPYEKRPVPYTARTRADYKAYKDPSEGHGWMSEKVGAAKNIQIGRKHFPEDSQRDAILEAREVATSGRYMANLAVQGRVGFEQKYPQAYESRDAIRRHTKQVTSQSDSAKSFRDSQEYLDHHLAAWERQRERQGRR